MSCTLVFSGRGLQLSFYPHHCTLSLAISYVLWGICAPVGGWALPGPFPLSVVNNYFLQMGYGVGVGLFLVYPYVLFGLFGLLLW